MTRFDNMTRPPPVFSLLDEFIQFGESTYAFLLQVCRVGKVPLTFSGYPGHRAMSENILFSVEYGLMVYAFQRKDIRLEMGFGLYLMREGICTWTELLTTESVFPSSSDRCSKRRWINGIRSLPGESRHVNRGFAFGTIAV
jgi:hypothetical protein